MDDEAEKKYPLAPAKMSKTPSWVMLGFILGPMLEENFRRALLLSQGDLAVFVQRPISAAFLSVAALLIAGQLYVRFRRKRASTLRIAAPEQAMDD